MEGNLIFKELDELFEKTQFISENMTLDDIKLMRTLMREYRKQIDDFIISYYDFIETWANLDIESIILSEVEPDYSKLRNLMGVRV